MGDLLKKLENKGISLPEDVQRVLAGCQWFTAFDTVRQLADAAVGGDNNSYEVKYDIPIINKRISVTPISLVAAASDDQDYIEFAKTLIKQQKR